MNEWMNSAGNWFSDMGNSAKNYLSNGQNLAGLGQLVGGIGGAYAGYKQSKAAEDMLKMQKESFLDEKKRRNMTQLSLDEAFNTQTPIVPALKLGV